MENQEEKKPISKEQFKLILNNLINYLKDILSKMDINDILFVIKEVDCICIITIDPNQCKKANVIIEKKWRNFISFATIVQCIYKQDML